MSFLHHAAVVKASEIPHSVSSSLLQLSSSLFLSYNAFQHPPPPPELFFLFLPLTHWTMQDTEPVGPGLRSLILRHNPLWQLTFHRSEISRQGHPWVLFSPCPRCAAFKTPQMDFFLYTHRQALRCDSGCQRATVSPDKVTIRQL